jgi:integrase
MAKINFTKAALDALPVPPAGSRAEHWDTKQPGLQVRVTPAGKKTFYIKRRVKNGGVEREALGPYPEMTIEQARKAAADRVSKQMEGESLVAARRARRAELTFAQLFGEYLDRHAKLKKRTWREDEQKYRDYLEKPLGDKRISQITKRDIAAIHSRITRDGHPTAANRVKDTLSSVFGRAIEWGLLETNPAKGIRDNTESSRDRFLSADELPRLSASLADEPNEAFRDYFILALMTGARRANVGAMRWADVDLPHGVWRIPMTKNGQPQNVPLVPEAVALLRRRQHAKAKDAIFVFPASRADSKLGHMSGERKAWLRTLDRDELSQLAGRIGSAGGDFSRRDGESLTEALARARACCERMKIATEGARLEDVRIHDLRRTMGSWQARTGASMVIIGKSLGHRSQQATAVYARLDLDPVRSAMETATSAMLEAAAGAAERRKTNKL